MLPKSGPNRTSSRYVGQALKAEVGRDDTSREPSMSSNIAMQCVSRRKIFSLVAGAAAVGLAVPATMLTASDAEAQTTGMIRRQERREGRHERRDDRREARQGRRDTRRGTTTTGSSAPAAGSSTTAPK